MIGGTDVVIPGTGDSAALETCARVIQGLWPAARFEDAETGESFSSADEIPAERVRELFVYSNASAEAAWNADDPETPSNSMLYLIFLPDSVTAVVEDASTPQMRAILDSIRGAVSYANAVAAANGHSNH
jgi:hypothetical protein